MAFSPTVPATDGPGSRPIRVVSLMADPRTTLSVPQAFQRGVGTAHRGICYSHTDFRNFGPHRSSNKGKVGT